MDIRRVMTACAAAAAAVVVTATTAAAATEVEKVHPSDLGGEWHTADTRPDGELTFDDEYGGKPGKNAAVLTTRSSGAKVQLFTDAHDGTYLRDITAISYATYQAEAPTASPALPAINMRVDLGNDLDSKGAMDPDVDTYLVYEPYQDRGNGAIEGQTWQTWDAWRDGAAVWWSSAGGTGCPQSTPCTIDELLELYPEAAIREDDTSLRSGSTPADADFRGSFGLNQGSGNAGIVGAADALHIATRDGVDVTYDFEADVQLRGKNDCKNGGWATSSLPEFRNQGACVSHFATRK